MRQKIHESKGITAEMGILFHEERETIKGRVRSASLRLCINLDTMLGVREINIQISARNDPGEGVEYGVESI